MKQIPFSLVVLPPQPECGSAKDNYIEQLRAALLHAAAKGNLDEAHACLRKVVGVIESDEYIYDVLTVASCYQIGAWVNVASSMFAPAIDCVIKALRHLALAEPKTVEVEAMMAALLYDYALACHALNSASKAEKSLKRSLSIYIGLVKRGGQRYLDNVAYEASAVTTLVRSSLGRLHVLDQLQSLFSGSEAPVSAQGREALEEFVASVSDEASSMMEVGRFRTSVRYYTKALRICRYKSGGRRDRGCFGLAVSLAEALLQVPMRKETADKLLSVLRKQAETEGWEDEILRIDTIRKKEELMQFNLLSFIKNMYT